MPCSGFWYLRAQCSGTCPLSLALASEKIKIKMFDKFTNIADYFRKIPTAFLLSIIIVIGLILFLPDETAKTLSIDIFRNEYRKFLGPALLLTTSFAIARLIMFIYRTIKTSIEKSQNEKVRLEYLQKLTPEEKGYLATFIIGKQNSINVGLDDGVMSGLERKQIVYRASNVGDVLRGFAFNLQPWAREILESNHNILAGATGKPKTPSEKTFGRYI